MSTKSNETTLRAMQMTTSDTPASPLRSFFYTCRSSSNTGLLVLLGVLFLTFSLYLPGRFATHDTLVSMMFQLPELGLCGGKALGAGERSKIAAVRQGRNGAVRLLHLGRILAGQGVGNG